MLGAGSIRVDFGSEGAAWLEIESPDMPPAALDALRLSVSETAAPYKFASSGLLDKVAPTMAASNRKVSAKDLIVHSS